MTIQRQYSLPNCTLALEGLGDMTIANSADPRPLMSILINAECHLPGQEKPLSGGRDFLESLIAAVSRYVQEFFSGITSGISVQSPAPPGQPVQLSRLDENRHRLTLRPLDVPPDTGIAAHLSREVDLSTVQLFDLVEAIDQFLADTRTMPDMTLNLAPVSRRYVRSEQPITKRAVPAAIGASSLAAAALALSFLPAPQVKQPKDLFYHAASTTGTATPTPAATPPSATPNPPNSAVPATSPTSAATPSATLSAAQLEANLATAPEISDPTTINSLRQQLFSKLDTAWKTRTPVTQDLVYRVGMTQDGRIVGYKPVNPPALDESKKTPLLDLVALPAAATATTDAIAQYKVVFTSSGLVEVAPWKQVMESPVSASPEITDGQQLETILPKLRSQILENWKADNPPYKRDLEFRVKVKPDGTIVDYRPENQTANDYVQATPLPQLGKLAEDSAVAQESYALFKVVFTPNGLVEISPWRGWK